MERRFDKGDLVRGVKGAPYVVTDENMLLGEVLSVNGADMCVKVLKHLDERNVGRTFDVSCEYFEHTDCRIEIYRKGNKVVAKFNNNHKITGVARCSPEDEFDFCTGAKLALDRLVEKFDPIKVGDIVYISDTGKLYTTYTSWVMENVPDDALKLRYDYGTSLGFEKDIRTVREKFTVLIIVGTDMYIQRIRDDKCYMIGSDGVEKW